MGNWSENLDKKGSFENEGENGVPSGPDEVPSHQQGDEDVGGGPRPRGRCQDVEDGVLRRVPRPLSAALADRHVRQPQLGSPQEAALRRVRSLEGQDQGVPLGRRQSQPVPQPPLQRAARGIRGRGSLSWMRNRSVKSRLRYIK